MLVDGASLTVVKDTFARKISELPVPILLEGEEVLKEAKAIYPDDV
jgi:hypothetical protein